MSHVASEHVRPARRVYPRRIHRVAPDRLPETDMRTRRGRKYLAAYRAALEEFPGAPGERIAEICRLRAIAEMAQQACLNGSGSPDNAIRCANVAHRAARDLMLTTKGSKSSDGSNALQAYLAARAQEADAAELEADVEVDLEFNKRPPFESAPASEHAAPDPDIAPVAIDDAGGACDPRQARRRAASAAPSAP
jgi:hypothetical protein